MNNDRASAVRAEDQVPPKISNARHNLTSPLGFRYSLGEVLAHAALDANKANHLVRLTVIERHLTETPGGVTRYYSCRLARSTPYHTEVLPELLKCWEGELVALPPELPAPVVTTTVAS